MDFFTLIWLFGLISVASAQISGVEFTLPWGTWEASSYDENGEYYSFYDIRFAKSPTGGLRFAKPQYPDAIENKYEIQSGPDRVACLQVNKTLPCVPGGNSTVGPYPVPPAYTSEDCLFFDLYVPKAVYDAAHENNIANTPVVFWIYGGAYAFGMKNDITLMTPFYNGSGVIQSAANFSQNVIFVAGNYRLGALGWLAGETMENDDVAVPNAGLYDQRMLLELISDNIAQVGGDKSQITAWGESAGAGSLLHHLVANWDFNGYDGPGFTSALLESPAYQWAWDRTGSLENAFQNFSMLAGCTNDPQPIACLQNIDSSEIFYLNELFFEDYTACTGLFNVGPALDGNLIWQLPPISFLNGNVASLDSLIISHVDNEALNFVPGWVQSPANFTTFVDDFFNETSLQSIREEVEAQYPESGPPYYGNQTLRLRALIQDSSFTCNTRQLYNAYSKRPATSVYALQFSINVTADYPTILPEGAYHALDLVPTFWTEDWQVAEYLATNFGLPLCIAEQFETLLANFSGYYQSYYASFALTGNPNSFVDVLGTPTWQKATNNGEYVTNVMRAGLLVPPENIPPPISDMFNASYVDLINNSTACDFWNKMAIQISELDSSDRLKSDWRGGEQTRIPDEL